MGGDSLLVEAFRRRRLLHIPARNREFLLTVYKRACIFTSRISGGRPRSDRNPNFSGGRLTCSRPERGDTMLRKLFHRLRASLRRGKIEREMERELRFHLEMETAENIRRGMSEEEARRVALLSFGGVERTKENLRDARGLGWLEDMLQDFRYALRALRRKPGFAAIALLTLALGIGTTTVMFTVINGVLLKPLPVPEPDRLLALQEQTEKPSQVGNLLSFTYPNFLDCRRESRSMDMTAWRFSGGTVSERGEAEYVSGFQISSELFSVLGVSLSQGRAFLHEEDRLGAAPVSSSATVCGSAATAGVPQRSVRSLFLMERPIPLSASRP